MLLSQRWIASFSVVGLSILLAGCGELGDKTVEPPAQTPTWIVEVQPLLTANCAVCHQNPPLNGAPEGFRLDKFSRADTPDAGSVDGAFEMRDRIKVRAVIEGSMPFGGPPLPPAQRALLRAWIDGGAPFAPPDARSPFEPMGRPAAGGR